MGKFYTYIYVNIHISFMFYSLEWYHIETIASGNLKYNPYSALSRNKMESHLLIALISANYYENIKRIYFVCFYRKGDNTGNFFF